MCGGIIPLENTRSVSHPQKRKVSVSILLIQRWPIRVRLLPRYSTRRVAHLLDLLAGASLLQLEEGNPRGVSVGGRETESNLSRHAGCLPKRSRGIQEPRPWNACSPIWRGCLARRRASWELPLLPRPRSRGLLQRREAQCEGQVPILRGDWDTTGSDPVREGGEKWVVFSAAI